MNMRTHAPRVHALTLELPFHLLRFLPRIPYPVSCPAPCSVFPYRTVVLLAGQPWRRAQTNVVLAEEMAEEEEDQEGF